MPAQTDAATRCASRSARPPAAVTLNCRRERPPRTGNGSVVRDETRPLSSSRCSVVYTAPTE